MKTLVNLATTPTSWLFLAVAVIAGFMCLYYLVPTIAGGGKKFLDFVRKSENINVDGRKLLFIGMHALVLGVITWQSAMVAISVANGGKLIPLVIRVIVLFVLLIVGIVLYFGTMRDIKRDTAEGERRIDVPEINRCKGTYRGLVVATMVLIAAVSINACAGLNLKPAIGGVSKDAEEQPADGIHVEGEEVLDSKDYDESLAPSDLDLDEKVEYYYNKYSSGKVIEDPFKAYDEARKSQSLYEYPVTFQRNGSEGTAEEKKRTECMLVLDCPTYGGAHAEMLSTSPAIVATIPEIQEFAQEHQQYEADDTKYGGLNHWIRKKPGTDKEKMLSQRYKEFAVLVCELIEKGEYCGIETWMTAEQWGLPTTYETIAQIPENLRSTYHVTDKVPNRLRYEKHYTAPEKQNDLPANIWTIPFGNGQKFVYGTAVDNWNQKLYPTGKVEKEAARITTTTVTTDTPNTPNDPPTTYTPNDPDNPPADDPGNDPGEDPGGDPGEDPGPAKNKNDSTANNPNTPSDMKGDNENQSGTNNEGHQDKEGQNGTGTENRDDTASGGPNSGGDNNKTSGDSSGVNGGGNDTPQSSPTGGNTDNGNPPPRDEIKVDNSANFVEETVVPDGNGNQTVEQNPVDITDGVTEGSTEIAD